MTASKNDIYHGIASIVMEIPQNSIYVSVFQSYSTGTSSKEINWKISRNSQREEEMLDICKSRVSIISIIFRINLFTNEFVFLFPGKYLINWFPHTKSSPRRSIQRVELSRAIVLLLTPSELSEGESLSN